MKRYKWFPSESAPVDHPMKILSGHLIFPDGGSIYIPDRVILTPGWGRGRSLHIAGSEFKPLPSRLSITWFSYTENRFYQGDFDLPLEHMQALFERGFSSPADDRPRNYDFITVGVAPGGAISVWLAGAMVVREAAVFDAKAVELPWSCMLDDPQISREEYVQNVLEEHVSPEARARLTTDGPDLERWRVYRRQYPWTLRVVNDNAEGAWMYSYNGEQEYFRFPETEPSERSTRAVPSFLNIYRKSGAEGTLATAVEFDKTEIFEAFANLAEKAPAGPWVLEVEVSDTAHAADIWLRHRDYAVHPEKHRARTSLLR